jgi:uncharacterized protein
MAQPDLTRRSFLPKPSIKNGIYRFLYKLNQRYQAMVYLVLLGVAELLVSIWEPRTGMLMYGFILMVLLFQATLFSRGLWQKSLIALSLAPLIRLVSLTMPLPEFPFVYWYFVVGAPLFIATIILIRVTKLTAPMVGLTCRKLFWQVMVGLSGLGLGMLEYLILRPDPLIEELSWRFFWLPALILLIFTGFLEELIFRGVMQYSVLRSLGRFGLYFVSAVFAVLHFGYRSLLDVLFVFAVAVYFAIFVQRTGSLLGVAFAHGLTNISLFLIFPFLLANPVQQMPVPQDIIAPRPPVAFTPIIIPTRTPTPTSTLIFTPTLAHTSTAEVPTYTFLPPATQIVVTETPLPVTPACFPRSNWPVYIVQFGDTLSGIAQRYGLPLQDLIIANCLLSVNIYAGQQLYVPYLLSPTLLPPSLPPSPIATWTQTYIPTTMIPTETQTLPAQISPTYEFLTALPPTESFPTPAPVFTPHATSTHVELFTPLPFPTPLPILP